MPPLPRPPHRPFPHGACEQKGLRGQLPATSPPRPPPYRQQIATANKAEIAGAGSPAGIKAPSGACSNRRDSDVRCPRLRRHLRPPPCPPLPRLAYYWGLFALGKAKAARRRAFPVPSEQRGSGGPAAGEGYLSLCLSFINVRDSALPLSLSASCSRLAPGRPSSSPAQARAQWCTKDTRNPQIRFQIELPVHKLTLCPWTPRARRPTLEGLREGRLIHEIGSARSFQESFWGNFFFFTIFFFYYFLPLQRKTPPLPPFLPLAPAIWLTSPLPCEAGEIWRQRLVPLPA